MNLWLLPKAGVPGRQPPSQIHAQIAKNKMASNQAPISTLNDLFRQAVAADKPGLLNFKQAGQWQALSAHELAERVRAATLGLYALEVRPGDHVGILAENCVEWLIADLGTLNCGAADVPIYATQAAKQVQYILQDAGVQVLFISNQKQYDRVREFLPDTQLRTIIAFEPLQASERVLQFEEFLNLGRAAARQAPDLYETLSQRVSAETLATLIYTSGTTGAPKGVRLSHGNLLASVLINYRDAAMQEEDVALSFLPFSHIFERSTIYVYLFARVSTYLAESIETVAQNLQEARPHFMTSVPRLFEKIYAKTLAKAEAGGKLKAALAEWSFEIARQWARLASENQPIPARLALKHKIADLLVLSKWRAALGGRIKMLVAGGAALSKDLAYVFYGAGLPIYQGYGLTESSPTIACNNARENRIGSVGCPGPVSACASPQMAKSLPPDRTSCLAITTARQKRLKHWKPTPPAASGCTPATLAIWMLRVTCTSRTARKICLKPAAANTLPRNRSRTRSNAAASSTRSL